MDRQPAGAGGREEGLRGGYVPWVIHTALLPKANPVGCATRDKLSHPEDASVRGSGEGADWGESGEEGARKPLSRACGKRRLEGCVCSCLVSALGLAAVRLALRWRRVTQEGEGGAAQRERESKREALRAGGGGGRAGEGCPASSGRQAGGQLPAHHDMTTRDHGVPTTPL